MSCQSWQPPTGSASLAVLVRLWLPRASIRIGEFPRHVVISRLVYRLEHVGIILRKYTGSRRSRQRTLTPARRAISARSLPAIRARTGLNDHGAQLFADAFYDPPRLRWAALTNDKERASRVELFKAAFGAYRNPSAHRELLASLTEFLLLNHLYLLERKSEKVESSDKAVDIPNREGAIIFRDLVGRREGLYRRQTARAMPPQSRKSPSVAACLRRRSRRYGLDAKINQ